MTDGSEPSKHDDERLPRDPAPWDATAYHVVSVPQRQQGSKVLARLELRGDETVLDAGCGTGRVTEMLLERLPRGHVVALDRDEAMLRQARAHLSRFGDRVSFVRGALPALPAGLSVDVVFSTATFHWVRDHVSLFRACHGALRPGGVLHAQCGGAGNIARTRARFWKCASAVEYQRWLGTSGDPWLFATPEETRARLSAAGFTDVEADLEDASTSLSSGEEYRTFLEKVIFGDHLRRIDDARARAALLDALMEEAARDESPFLVDYVRLNVHARRE